MLPATLSRKATAGSRRPPGLIWSAAVAALLAVAGCGDGDQTTTTTTTEPPAAQTSPGRPAPPTVDGAGVVRLAKVGEFDQPVYVTQPPGDGNDLFVVEQTGRVVVVRDGKALDTPFLDLSDR